MRILFITRKFPPSTGGMENAAYELYEALRQTHDVRLVKWGGSNMWLPVVYPWLLVQAVVLGLRKKPDVVYLQDGIMAPLGTVVKMLLGRPTVMTIHGLEVTYRNPIYRLIVLPLIGRQNRLVAVSTASAAELGRLFPHVKVDVVWNGLRDSFYNPGDKAEARKQIVKQTCLPAAAVNGKLLYTNGRLVARKGVAWFVDEVIPQLDNDVYYLVSGTGREQERQAIEWAIARHGLQDHVKLLGRISNELRGLLYNNADMFVMPNVPIAHDMEGFGLVALEAASCGTLVVASKLEGIQDAIKHGKNGLLVAPRNADEYVQCISAELQAPSLKAVAIRDYTLSHYSWQETARQYTAAFESVARSSDR